MRTMCKLAQQPMLLQAVHKHDYSDFAANNQVEPFAKLHVAHLIVGVHCDNSVQWGPTVLVAVMLQPATVPSA